jgi:hypothetical protein
MFEGLFQPTHLIILFAIALLVFENQQGDRKKDNKMRRLKQTLEHRNLPRRHYCYFFIRYRRGRGKSN